MIQNLLSGCFLVSVTVSATVGLLIVASYIDALIRYLSDKLGE